MRKTAVLLSEVMTFDNKHFIFDRFNAGFLLGTKTVPRTFGMILT